MNAFVVVEFIGGGGGFITNGSGDESECEVDVIPYTWMVSQTKAYWPPFRKVEAVKRAQVHSMPPDPETWRTYTVKVVCAAASYQSAAAKLKDYVSQLCNTTDLNASDREMGRGARKLKKRRLSISTSSDDESHEKQAKKKKKKLPAAPQPPPLPLHPIATSCGGAPAIPTTSVTPVTHRVAEHRIVSSHQPGDGPVLRAIAELQVSQSDIMKEIQHLKLLMQRMLDGMQSATHHVSAELPEDIVLPLQTLNDVDVLEGKLTERPIRQALENKLAVTGGATLKDSVRRTMGLLLTNSLSTKFNWEGRLGWKSPEAAPKRAFSGLLLTSIIGRSILRNPLLGNTTVQQVEKEMMLWLRGSADREGGRRRRDLKKAASMAIDNYAE